MNILVTGAGGFIGKNLSAALKNILNGSDKKDYGFSIGKLFLIDADSSDRELDEACMEADFVFNLAGINIEKNEEEFVNGNFGFPSKVLQTLEKYNNFCPVMQASSIQATLEGRYDNPYGRSKREAEKLFFEYSERTGARTLVYRFPNCFGKWCRPNYNSVVATFCYNIANGLPIQIKDPDIRLELVYIDDLVKDMLSAISGNEARCEYVGLKQALCDSGRFCALSTTYSVTLGEIAEYLRSFKTAHDNGYIPDLPQNSFKKKLYSTYLSYLPREDMIIAPKVITDKRGAFAELIKSADCGQISVNITKPGEIRGGHWHNSKNEVFFVLSGRGVIEMQSMSSGEKMNFEVSGENVNAVRILPGYIHSIKNLSENEDLVTLIWANETFDAENTDTYFCKSDF